MGYYYADAMNALQEGQAAKSPRWRGYVKKGPVAEDGSYDLTFVKADGTEIVFHVAADGAQTAAGSIVFDGELNADMMSNDWMIGPAEDFEVARAGGGSGQF